MEDPIRMLHFADVHIGMENYGAVDPVTGTSTRVRDFLDRLDEVIDFAIEHEVDLAVFAGDAFKSRNPDPTQQREFASRIKRLSDAAPTLLLVGNHDMPAMVSKANSVDIFRALDVPNVIVGYKPEGRVVETRRGPVFLAWVPYPMRNRMLTREEYGGMSIEQLEGALRERVWEIVRDLTRQAESMAMPRVLTGHFSVAEAKLGSEQSAMLGRDVVVNRSALEDDTWDFVALGHIHRHQQINPGSYPAIVYSGSLERIDFGEEGEDKGFCWVQLSRGQTKWSFETVEARPFQTIKIDGREMDDPTEVVLERLGGVQPGAVVRVLVDLRPDQDPLLREREIRSRLDIASSVSVQRQVDTEVRARLGVESPETLSSLQLIERYLHAREVPAERIEVLLKKTQELIDPG
jgi:exonuclease SbcD